MVTLEDKDQSFSVTKALRGWCCDCVEAVSKRACVTVEIQGRALMGRAGYMWLLVDTDLLILLECMNMLVVACKT